MRDGLDFTDLAARSAGLLPSCYLPGASPSRLYPILTTSRARLYPRAGYKLTYDRTCERSRSWRPGHIAFGYGPPAGPGLRPVRVEHAQLGITWDVTGILDSWQHPGRVEQTLGQATLT